MLVALGVPCGFVTDPAAIDVEEAVPAVVIARRTRVVPAAEAVALMEEGAMALQALDVRQIFFKYCATFDSTDEGNIGPVADRLLELTGAPLTAFCPAAPQSGRTVYNGHLFVGTQLVSESAKRHDPLTPMTDPDLVRVLRRQTRYPVGLLSQADVGKGEDHLRSVVAVHAAQGTRHLIADAIDDRDLAALAAATWDWPLMTGNATVASHYPPIWRAKGLLPVGAASRDPGAAPPVRGPGVVLSGSCAERTFEQLADFERAAPVLRLDLLSADDPSALVARALDWALPRLAEGSVAIATSASLKDLRASQARHGRDGAARMAEAILGRIAVALHAAGVRRFVVAGGETSGAVLEHLGIRRLNVGPYGGPGIGSAVTLGDDPSAFCLKSGKLGPTDLFRAELEAMRQGSL